VANERLLSAEKEMVSRSRGPQATGLIRTLQPQLDQIPRANSSLRPPTKIKKNMEGVCRDTQMPQKDKDLALHEKLEAGPHLIAVA
jgi:hypothetical protein